MNERGLRVLLGLQAIVSTAIGIWGMFVPNLLQDVLGLKVPPDAAGLAHLFGAVMLAVAVAYALAAAQPHRNRAFLVPLFLVPLVIAVAMIASIAQKDAAHNVRAGVFAAYNLAYCLLYFRVYPRLDTPDTSKPPST